MAEITLQLSDNLVNGLRSDDRFPVNSPALELMDMLKPTQFGARTYDGITNAISSGELSSNSITVAHPYPQIFKGKGITLLLTANKLFTVDESDWSLTPVTVYTPAGDVTVITSDSIWHFADFQGSDFWMLFNGTSVIWKDSANWTSSNRAYIVSTQTMKTGCSFRGRLILGGFNASNFWNSGWQTLWSSWLARFESYGFSLGGPGGNWIWWSAPGGGDILSFFTSVFAQTGLPDITNGHTVQDPIGIEQAMINASGFMPLDNQGDIVSLKALRNHVVVYGNDGVSAVTPYSQPFATFGLQERILPIGLAARGAVGGDLDEHIFMDNSGVIWRLDNQLKLQRLGYKEFGSTLLGNEILIGLDPNERDYYISDDTDCFCLNASGMGKCDQLVQGVFYADGGLIGIAEDATNPNAALIRTLPLDMNVPGIKTIHTLEVFTDGIASVQVALDYRHSTGDAWVTSAFVEGSPAGVYYLGIAGTEFRVRVKGTLSGAGYVEKIVVRFTHIDARMVRGPRHQGAQVQPDTDDF